MRGALRKLFDLRGVTGMTFDSSKNGRDQGEIESVMSQTTEDHDVVI